MDHSEATEELELSIVMPCLDEAETLGTCIDKAKGFMERYGVIGEVVVADNGSTDGSLEIAREHGARVVHVEQKGYGSALIGGLSDARGKYVIMGDSDDSHDLAHLDLFVDKLREGYELVVGNRFQGKTRNKELTYMHRSLGNQFLTLIGKIFFSTKIGDFHCGLRGMTREAFLKMNLRTTGMEFASEMIVKAIYSGLRITEVPTEIFPSGRSRPAHLRPIRDGWRHLRFLLLYSPRWLFLYPGISMMVVGALVLLWLMPGSQMNLDVHTMLFGTTAILIGLQGVSFAVLTKTFAIHEGLLPDHPKLQKILRYATLEKGLLIGGLMIATGVAGVLYVLLLLDAGSFAKLGFQYTMRIVILSVTLLSVGVQVAFSSFFYSIINLKTKKD